MSVGDRRERRKMRESNGGFAIFHTLSLCVWGRERKVETVGWGYVG